MQISLSADCGNAQRVAIVCGFVVSWAKLAAEAVAAWLADDTCWLRVGTETHRGQDAEVDSCPDIAPERVEVISVITHG